MIVESKEDRLVGAMTLDTAAALPRKCCADEASHPPSHRWARPDKGGVVWTRRGGIVRSSGLLEKRGFGWAEHAGKPASPLGCTKALRESMASARSTVLVAVHLATGAHSDACCWYWYVMAQQGKELGPSPEASPQLAEPHFRGDDPPYQGSHSDLE